MEKKYDEDIQKEINFFLKTIKFWRKLFYITTNYYYDGWSISLIEKNAYPRRIVLFKSYQSNSYSIKSFELHLNEFLKYNYEELYFVNNIIVPEELIMELKEIIYGKDLVNFAKKELIDKLS